MKKQMTTKTHYWLKITYYKDLSVTAEVLDLGYVTEETANFLADTIYRTHFVHYVDIVSSSASRERETKTELNDFSKMNEQTGISARRK